MNHDSHWKQIVPADKEPEGLIEMLIQQSHQALEPQPSKRRGRPAQIRLAHLGWAMVWCFLQGWHAQLDVWRQLRFERLGPFVPVEVTDQAVYKRLAQSGIAALQMLFESVSELLHERLGPHEAWQLAPFASAVLALDESQLDAVGRWLSGLRELPLGDRALLAGRLCCLFDIRKQQWVRVDVLRESIASSLLHARQMLTDLPLGALLLFDRGYFSFAWFDELTRRGFFWITRLRARSSYQIIHIFVQKDGYLDALVHLGTYRADHAEYAVRLIQIGRGQTCWRYLTNVLDPRLVSGAEVVQLYRRRWDIELAFRTLKEHLHLNVLWSAKWEVIQVQILAALLLAQIFHALLAAGRAGRAVCARAGSPAGYSSSPSALGLLGS
jgi:hypothetical protein